MRYVVVALFGALAGVLFAGTLSSALTAFAAFPPITQGTFVVIGVLLFIMIENRHSFVTNIDDEIDDETNSDEEP